MTKLELVAKGGLAVLIVVSIGVLIERLTDTRHYNWVMDIGDENNHITDINGTISPTVDIEEPIFVKKFSECLIEHSKSQYYQNHQISRHCVPHEKCIHDFLIDLSRLMKTFGIKLLLLEPALLFCLLPPPRKYNLVTRGFSTNKGQQSRNVITFGIHHSDAKILDEASTRRKIVAAGYKILRFERNVDDRQKSENETPHYFIRRNDYLMHLIVLNLRETYLWSSGLNISELSLKGLQYTNDRAFENFTLSLVHMDNLSTAPIFLPSDARCFLLDMMTSSFLECNVESSYKMDSNEQIASALKELKTVLASQMVTFLLWSKTLQGWYEECDVLHYSEELKFLVAAKSVIGYNFTGLFASSECQVLETNYNLNSSIKSVKLNCKGIYIDLIFYYEDKDTYWYEFVDGKNTYRLKFQKFTLCSTDVFGQKFGIPCETNEIFDGEYGQFLRNTSLILNSENMKYVQLMDKS